jgi:hypothetical protein
MLIAPEPGGAPGDVVSIGEDEPAPAAAAPAAVIAAAASPPQATPVIHLQRSGLHGAYTDHVGHDFQSPQLSPRSFAKKAAPKAPPPEAAPKTIPHFITSPRSLDDTGIPQKDVFVPSSLHPEIVPETVFWDYEHKRKAVIAGLIALTGVLYLMFVMGVFNALVAKPRDDS